MKAPDKIYLIQRTRLVDWLAPTWYREPTDGFENHAYIRKDALLEWAKNWEKIGVSEDFAYAIEKLIKHIESL